MWIKICGNTSLEDARFAAECGADAVGFVFAPSPRQVEAKLVRQITEKLPSQVEKYGVFVDAGFDEIVSTVAAAGLTGVQLHRSSDALLPSRLRQHFAQRRLGILRVLHYKEQEFEHQLTELGGNDSLDGVLVDSSTAASGGRHRHQLQLAGGAEQLPPGCPASTADCGRWPGPGKCEAGNPGFATLGSRRGERRRKRAWQEGSRTGAGLYPGGPASGGGRSRGAASDLIELMPCVRARL